MEVCVATPTTAMTLAVSESGSIGDCESVAKPLFNLSFQARFVKYKLLSYNMSSILKAFTKYEKVETVKNVFRPYASPLLAMRPLAARLG